MEIKVLPQSLAAPVWPDDDITRGWLEGIAEYRQQCDQQPDAWEVVPESGSLVRCEQSPNLRQ